jgi:hypothetical protein
VAARKKPAAVRLKKTALPVSAGRIGEGGEVGSLIDKLRQLADLKAEAAEALAEAKRNYDVLEGRVLSALARAKLAGGRGRFAQASIGSHVVPNVTDWDAVYKWILKTRDTSLLQRRVSATHWGELLDAKKTVPGIAPVTLTVLSLTKVKF